ncbi:MAG: hypothetical protein Q8O84_05460, partial [Nanoarchaeota archaeon]|nr:hypothetical protein [Nanoarchaeota archaeon]
EKNGTVIKQVNSLDLIEIALCEKPANPGAMFDILKSMPEEIEQLDINGLIEQMSNLSITIPGFFVYFEEGEFPKLIIVSERTNSLVENIISELGKVLDKKAQIITLSKELLSGNEIPLFKIKLEPIGFEEETKEYVDVEEILHDNNVFGEKQDAFFKSLVEKLKGE